MTERLVEAVERLSFEQRSVVVLRYVEGLSIEETAAALRCTSAAVKSRAHRGLASLRSSLEQDAQETPPVRRVSPPSRSEEQNMLTDDDLITELSRLRERGEGIEYAGEVPLTRRSAAATIVPVAAVAAVATLGTAAVVGAGNDGPGAGSSGKHAETSAGTGLSSPLASDGGHDASIKLVSAKITLGGKTIAYQHAAGEDPFGDGWQLAIDFGASLPADATRFDLGDGNLVWVADSPDAGAGASVLIVTAGPRNDYIGAPSSFSRADLEAFVRTNLHGQ